MTSLTAPAWSESLKTLTRETIAQQPVTPDRRLHFKHQSRGYAFAGCDDIGRGRLILHTKVSGPSGDGGDRLWFNDVDTLLQAGWVLD